MHVIKVIKQKPTKTNKGKESSKEICRDWAYANARCNVWDNVVHVDAHHTTEINQDGYKQRKLQTKLQRPECMQMHVATSGIT